jgi:hypothetical protein
MWLEKAADRPDNPDAQVRWLFEWWRRLDDWIAGQPEPSAAASS